MNFLYHRVPKNMQGSILYPLNQLRNFHYGVYEEASKKYEGREFLMNVRIPTLDCLWNDVLHLIAVHPNTLKKAFEKANVPLRKLKWFNINPLELDKKKTSVYLYRDVPRFDRYKKEGFTEFDTSDLEKYSEISQKTIEYYKKEFHENRKRPFLFHLVPHILYRGEINVENCEIIK